jgi:hypothetical protein
LKKILQESAPLAMNPNAPSERSSLVAELKS